MPKWLDWDKVVAVVGLGMSYSSETTDEEQEEYEESISNAAWFAMGNEDWDDIRVDEDKLFEAFGNGVIKALKDEYGYRLKEKPYDVGKNCIGVHGYKADADGIHINFGNSIAEYCVKAAKATGGDPLEANDYANNAQTQWESDTGYTSDLSVTLEEVYVDDLGEITVKAMVDAVLMEDVEDVAEDLVISQAMFV